MTKKELQSVAHGIAQGLSVIDAAAALGVDRSTLSGRMKRGGFLDTVAAAIDTPAELGVEAFRNLFDGEQHEGERKTAYLLRLDFADAVRAAHADFFAKLAECTRQQAEREKVDSLNIKTMVEMRDRNWKKGTADEMRRGLDTPEKRKAYRLKHGIKWDCAGFGRWYEPVWDAKRCTVEYCDHPDSLCYWREIYAWQRAKFGYSWDDAPGKRLWELNGTSPPAEGSRDALLPVTAADAQELAEAVKAGADYLTAARKMAIRARARNGTNT